MAVTQAAKEHLAKLAQKPKESPKPKAKVQRRVKAEPVPKAEE